MSEATMTDAVPSQQEKKSWDRPEGATFEEWMTSRVVRLESRKYDWNALKFQADFDPRYGRAQMRYVGTGATGVAADKSTIPSENFTFSTMLIPAGHEGPLHLHTDAEEIFFVLRGKVKVMCEKDGEYWESIVGERDLISIPPGIYRGEVNIGDEDALMCVMIGARKPVTPTYPPDHPLASLKR